MKKCIMIVTGLVMQASPLSAQEGGGLLTVDGGLMIWTLIVFGLTFFILRRAAWPKLLAAVEARERAIEEQLGDARRAQEESERTLTEQQRLLERAHTDANELLTRAKGVAENERQALLEQTRAEQEEMLERARRDIEVEKERAVADLRREAVDLSLAAAARVLEQSVDSEKNRRIVNDYLGSLSKSP